MGGYAWRGKAWNLLQQDAETRAEWARYLTLNERSNEAYRDLRSMEMNIPGMLRTLDDRRAREVDIRRQRIAELETARLLSYHDPRTKPATPAA